MEEVHTAKKRVLSSVSRIRGSLKNGEVNDLLMDQKERGGGGVLSSTF